MFMDITDQSPEIVTLQAYLQNPGGFSVLVLGERGIGKTSAIDKIVKDLEKDVVTANCASFANDTIAESQLFGYVKGAYTGADKDNDGFFQAANGKFLFLDEIHNLSPVVQQKLMTALQTVGAEDEPNRGKYKINKLGSTKLEFVKLKPIFASNKEISELKKLLLPDFYDRIAQLIVEFPSLAESKADLFEEFKSVWAKMKFEKYNPTPGNKKFQLWLKTIRLSGNFRDLQKIAINWHQERIITYGNEEPKEYLKIQEDIIFEKVKSNFLKYHQSPSSTSISFNGFNFQKGKSKKRHALEYEKALLEWALSEEGYGGNVELTESGLGTTVRLKTRLKDVNKKLEDS